MSEGPAQQCHPGGTGTTQEFTPAVGLERQVTGYGGRDTGRAGGAFRIYSIDQWSVAARLTSSEGSNSWVSKTKWAGGSVFRRTIKSGRKSCIWLL